MKLQIQLLVFLSFLIINPNFSQDNFWEKIDNRTVYAKEGSKRYTFPKKDISFKLDFPEIKKSIALNGKSEIIIPLPNGSFEKFIIEPSGVMPPELAAKFPNIQTFKGFHAKYKYPIHLDYSKHGFFAMIKTPEGTAYIDPMFKGDDRYYISYYHNDLVATDIAKEFICGNKDNGPLQLEDISQAKKTIENYRKNGEPVVKRQYTLGFSCTGEYTSFHGGTKEDALAALVTGVNRLNLIFLADLAIEMVLYTKNEDLIFLNKNTDPYTNGSTDQMISQSQQTFDLVVQGKLDIGHVVGTGGWGGLASLGAICSNNYASGATVHPNPVGDAMWVQIISHEFGHQLGANHSMSSCHNVNSGTAYEPGSGSTIMSYAGLCGPQNNIVPTSDDYYHSYSITEIFRHTRTGSGNDCATLIETENLEPEITIPYKNGFYIPISTPFKLTAEATDANNEPLYYNWEQLDLGPMGEPGSPVDNAPLFRSVYPDPNPTRVFPKMSTVLSQNWHKHEVLPTYSRDLTFRCTVRDYGFPDYEAGGTVYETVKFKVTDQAGPFLVTFPNGGEQLTPKDIIELSWDVANTNSAPVSCKYVNIYLSTDGGQTFDIPLSLKTPNDGKEWVSLPDVLSTQCRIIVEAEDNVFFNVSYNNFEIQNSTVPKLGWGFQNTYQRVCLPNQATYPINTVGLNGYSTATTFEVISDLPENVTVSFESNTITPGASNNMIVDLSSFEEIGNYQIDVRAFNEDTSLVRTIFFNTISNDYTDFYPRSPVLNQTDVMENPTFKWNPVPAADYYRIEVSTSPSFSEENILIDNSGNKDSIYQPSILLDKNTIYYWRVTPFNVCGAGPTSPIMAFHTVAVSCGLKSSTDTPINIPSSKSTKESIIYIDSDVSISDLNLRIEGFHAWFSDLTVKLIAPSGTKQTVFSKKCGNYNGTFNFKLDDEAPQDFSCPPKGDYFKPLSELGIFNGENAKGEWILQIIDDTNTATGKLVNWELEICSEQAIFGPIIVKNIPRPVRSGTAWSINTRFLDVQDENSEIWELKYNLVSLPTHGELKFKGELLTLDQSFSQSDIRWDNITYEMDEGYTGQDSFDFVVVDETGAWTGLETFNLFYDATTGTTVSPNAFEVKVFPNPTNSYLSVWVDKLQTYNVGITNIQGQALHLDISKDNMGYKINTSVLEDGVYFIKIESEKGVVVKKFIFQK